MRVRVRVRVRREKKEGSLVTLVKKTFRQVLYTFYRRVTITVRARLRVRFRVRLRFRAT